MVLAALLMNTAGCSKQEKSIKIGCILSLTGPGSHLIDLRDGMLLAVEEINKWGGVNGQTIELIIEDSKSDPNEAKKVFEWMEKTYHPVLYFSCLSSVSMALAPLAEKNKVPLVGLVTSVPGFTENREWAFRFYTVAKNEVAAILYWLKALKIKKLGILFQNDLYGKPINRILKKKSETLGRTVQSQNFEPAQNDFHDQIKALKSNEAIYVIGFVNQLKKILGQLKEGEFTGLVLAASGASSHSVKTLVAADNVYIAAPALYNPNYPFARNVVNKYEKKFITPLTHQAASAYDAVQLLAGLMEGKEISRAGIKQALEQGFIFTGILGRLQIKPGGHDIDFPLYPAQIVRGEIQYVKR